MGRYSGDPRTADELIASEKRAAIRRRFPSELLHLTYDQIDAEARQGKAAAQTAKKLLDRKRYDR
jgi:hypothetical protein